MKVMIDTCVIYDVLSGREPFWRGSLKIIKLCEQGIVKGVTTSLSIVNIHYNLRKIATKEKRNAALKMISNILETVDLTGRDSVLALDMEWKDYEDCVQFLAAKRCECDFIVTRNISDYKNSSIPAKTPEEFFEIITKNMA